MALEFATLASAVDMVFWSRLGEIKLSDLKLDEGPIKFRAFQAANQHAGIPGFLNVTPSSLDDAPSAPALSFGCVGKAFVFNTVEQVTTVDRKSLVHEVGDALWQAIQSGEVETAQSALHPCLLLANCDLKHSKYVYWFGAPCFQLPAQLRVLNKPTGMAKVFGVRLAGKVLASCQEFLQQEDHNHAFAWFVTVPAPDADSNEIPRTFPLKDHAKVGATASVCLAYLDSSPMSSVLGTASRNLLVWAARRWNQQSSSDGGHPITLLSLRARSGRLDAEASSVTRLVLPILQDMPPLVANWETNSRGKVGPRLADLSSAMDPARLAASAVDLNLRLMRWRAAPTLDVTELGKARCLLLGAGTLGCSVARSLLGWGVRHITFVDNARVSYSNPVRQSLYTFEDCKSGGAVKAERAAAALREIFPGVRAEGIAMNVPMSGHIASDLEAEQALKELQKLEELVENHDVIFLLMDTRESRWLPSVLGAACGKLVINAALGFDGYLVMRHGLVTDDNNAPRLGCYFCNDVVAPLDSTTGQALDQQCTVTRPGLSGIAGSLAVELAMSALSHPLGAGALSGPLVDRQDDGPLGAPPHMIRGQLTGFSQMHLTGKASAYCTACSPSVLNGYLQEGQAFILRSLQHPSSLEELTGLSRLHSESEALVEAQVDEDEGDDSMTSNRDDDDDWHTL